ncbi:MAG: preprotein translocase subunit SecE [Thiotrichales bacterium 12-47-6]|nr:MAG: preprotein translocase subunit SecE [Thiotrichales bacterium 12-47-6]
MKQQNTATSPADKFRYILSIALLVASLVAYYLLTDLDLALRVLIVVGGVAIAVAGVWTTAFGSNTRKHLNDTQREVRQVVWPTREQAVRMTLIVFVAVFFVGLFLWLVDMFFLWGVQWLTGRGE